jgi:hypothetical protein
MNLASYFTRYPNVRIAGRGDNERILSFYRKLSMQGGTFNILFVKEPDYFKFLEYESAAHAVGIVEDDQGNMEGMFAFAIRPCYVDGQRESTVHVSDLRFMRSRERKSKFDWKQVAADLCESGHTIDEFAGSRFLLGSFVMANERARKAIASQKAPFDISPVANYKMVNLLARKPFKWAGGLGGKGKGNGKGQGANGDPRIEVSRGSEAQREELRAFLDRQNRRRALGYVFEGPDDELARRLRVWDGFTMESFFIARDANRVILGCLAPWDLSAGRRIVVDNFPPVLAVAAKAIRPLLKKVPRPGEELRILYLTTQEIDLDLAAPRRKAVFSALLDAVYESGVAKDFHMVALCDYDNESFREEVDPSYFTMKTETMLYQLHRPSSPKIIREQDLSCHVGHEMCLT